MKINKAKTKIMTAVKIKLDSLEKVESQWKILKEQGCTCKNKYVVMTHKHDSLEMDQLLEKENVKNFIEAGQRKIYQVDKQYIYAAFGGIKIEEVNGNDTCYILKDNSNSDLGTIKGSTQDEVNTTEGILDVMLAWEDASTNLDLEVIWDGGENDVQDIACPKEHWSVENIEDVKPGRGAVWVHLKEPSDDSNISDTVTVMIKALNVKLPLVFEIKDIDDYNLRHVADIIITKSNGVSYSQINMRYSGPLDVGIIKHRRAAIRPFYCKDKEERYDCGCFPCSAEVIPYLEQALLGPLRGATFKLHLASEYSQDMPLLEIKTTEGNSLVTAGIIDVNYDITNRLDDDELYLLEAFGGEDIDSDDDYIVDSKYQTNKGTIHALMTGRDIKRDGYKINLLTEISYQVLKGKIEEIDPLEIRELLDETSKKLLREKIYTSSAEPLSYKDLIVWLPTHDKKLLFFDYNEKFVPVVEKIYDNQDIKKEAYDIVYSIKGLPLLHEKSITVLETVASGTKIGMINIEYKGSSGLQSFILDGKGHGLFKLDINGDLYIEENGILDHETKSLYNLTATATNSEGNTTVDVTIKVKDVQEEPLAISHTDMEFGIPLGGRTSVGTWIGEVKFDPGLAPISDMWLVGDNKEYFTIDISGEVSVAKVDSNGQIPYGEYDFEVIAENIYGESVPYQISINVYCSNCN